MSRAETISTLRDMLPLLERGYLEGDLSRLLKVGDTAVRCYCLIGAAAEVRGVLEYDEGRSACAKVDWADVAPKAFAELAKTAKDEYPDLMAHDEVSVVWRYNDQVTQWLANRELEGRATPLDYNELRIKLVQKTIARLEGEQA